MRRAVFPITYGAVAALLLANAVAPLSSEAQSPPATGRADDVVRFRITNPGQALYKIAIPAVLGDASAAAVMTEVLSADLGLSGFFKVLDPKSFVADLAKEDVNMAPDAWKPVGAESVIKAKVVNSGGDLAVEFRLYELIKGEQPVLGKAYRGPLSDTRKLAHLFAAEVLKYFTAEDSFFHTQIAFSRVEGKQQELTVMDWDGADVRQVTRNGSQNYLPGWSPGGDALLYTSFVRGSADLWQIPSAGGRPKRISTRPGMNTGGVFSPTSGQIAATLSFEGNSEIYLLSPGGEVIKRLTNNPGIDSSPSFSPDGRQIAFVSDRYGSPQIWVMAADGSGQRRLTTKGSYNQEPSWAPKPINGQSLIAFTGRDERGNFDIFTINVGSGELTRITEGRGSNSHPSWAPNARALTYKSSRGGIWISTFDGKTERQVYRGAAETPVWGPMRGP
jgi:TolB protein